MPSLGSWSRRNLLGTGAAGLALWPRLAGAEAPPPPAAEGENIQGSSDVSLLPAELLQAPSPHPPPLPPVMWGRR